MDGWMLYGITTNRIRVPCASASQWEIFWLGAPKVIQNEFLVATLNGKYTYLVHLYPGTLTTRGSVKTALYLTGNCFFGGPIERDAVESTHKPSVPRD